MITFFGIIIFAIPFVLVKLFDDKVSGFLTIFTSSFLLHLIVALSTQSLKVFSYSTIIAIYLLIDVVVLLAYYMYCLRLRKKDLGKEPFKIESTLNVFKKDLFKNFLVIIAFVIVFINLWSVHFNFSGVVNSYSGEYNVTPSSYIYPYFSDEWVAISFVNYTIGSHSLPIINPLSNDGEFKSPLSPYFSFLSDTFLFFGDDPLNNFATVTLLVGLTICALFFVLLSSLGIDKRISTITLLTIPYITNGGNLPGIWFLIPMTFSLIFYLISLIGFSKEDHRLLFVSSLMCLCLYPPFIVFVFPTLVALLFKEKKWRWKKFLYYVTTTQCNGQFTYGTWFSAHIN